jgi:hypothetical protein
MTPEQEYSLRILVFMTSLRYADHAIASTSPSSNSFVERSLDIVGFRAMVNDLS